MMKRIDALRALLGKVESGDEYGDDWIFCADIIWPELQTYQLKSDGKSAIAFVTGAYYNGSLDAAKDLHEAVLPVPMYQWHLSPEINFDGFVCSIFGCRQDRYVAASCDKDSARAWLIAILKALIAEEESND